MRRYTASWGLNLVPDPAEEEHESVYESAPTEIEGEDFAAAAAKVEQMAERDAQMTVPMDDKTGWTTWLADGQRVPERAAIATPPRRPGQPSRTAPVRVPAHQPDSGHGRPQSRRVLGELRSVHRRRRRPNPRLGFRDRDARLHLYRSDHQHAPHRPESRRGVCREHDSIRRRIRRSGSLATPMARPSENRRLRIPVRRIPHGSGSQTRLR